MKSIKKLLAVIMITALMVSCFAINASAKSYHQVTLSSNGDYAVFIPNGTGLYEPADAAAYLTNHGITWDGKTLTLNNTVITDDDVYAACESTFFFKDVTDPVVVVKGNCSISTNKDHKYIGIFNYGGNVTIKGDGTLKMNILGDDYTYGICAKGNLTICESVKLDITTVQTGLYAGDPDSAQTASILTIKDSAKVDITSTGESIFSTKEVNIEGNAQVNIVTDEDSCIWSQDTVNFKGTVNVNAVSNEAWACIHANFEIIFDLDKGGKVTAETKNDDEYACAFNAAAATTILLNREDGTDVTYPVGGKETKISNTFWAITESDGKTYAKKATVENKLVEYKIKESADEATWTKGGTDGQKITSTADFSKFVSVSVDGKVVDAANYDKAEGSTIITFKPTFLETLSLGEHPVVITSKDGSATGTLTIKEAAPAAEPEAVADTADTNAIAVFAALTALSAAGFVTVKKKEN